MRESTENQNAHWLRQLRGSVIGAKGFHKAGLVDPAHLDALEAIDQKLRLRIPEGLRKKLQNLNDPLAKQFLPDPRELISEAEEKDDPIGDQNHEPIKGLIHRYPNRVLLLPTHQCAVYCRFCFRSYQVSHPGKEMSRERWLLALNYIKEHPEIEEVIFSGGDPLTLTDRKLDSFLAPLNAIAHVRRIRFHTRVCTVLPERVTQDLLQRLDQMDKKVILTLHINSPLELTPDAKAAIGKFARTRVLLLHQAVLLRGVNDQVLILKELLGSLCDLGVLPYYFHYPDLARGTGHFRIPLEQAMELFASLRGELSGYAIPRLMIDLPGGGGKVDLTHATVFRNQKGDYEIKSPLTGQILTVSYPKAPPSAPNP